MKTLKPIFFNDFDGSMNGIPYDRVWIGPEKINGMYDPELYNPKNWAHKRLTHNPDIHFVPDNKNILTPDDREIPIRWSSELVGNIRDLIHNDVIEYHWLTMWKKDSITNLVNPLFGFDDVKAPSLPWSPRWNDESQIGKYFGLMRYLNENNIPTGTPIIWVDDIATRGEATIVGDTVDFSNNNWYHDPNTATDDDSDFVSKYMVLDDDDDEKHLSDYPHLIIKPNIEWGLTRPHYEAIAKFINIYS